MRKKKFAAIAIICTVAAIVLVGCTTTDPTEPLGTGNPNPVLAVGEKSSQSTTLVPDEDISNNAWIGYPDSMDSLYAYVDEGIPNSPGGDLIYTNYNGADIRFGFSEPTGISDIDIDQIAIVADVSLYEAEALLVQLTMTVYVNDQEIGSEQIQVGEMANPAYSDSLWVADFSGFCLDENDIATLEVAFHTSGVWWDAGMSAVEIYAVDAIIGFDERCDPVISDLVVNRKGDNFAIQWNTDCAASSQVIWGYSPAQLSYTANGGIGTTHLVNFTVAPDEGCIFMKAISAGQTCSAPADTSALLESVKEVVISNVVRSFDAFNCVFTVTWDTNVKSSSVVYWGATCGTLNNTATGAGGTTAHSVTFDATGIRANSRVYMVAESASDCGSDQSDCAFTYRSYCIN